MKKLQAITVSINSVNEELAKIDPANVKYIVSLGEFHYNVFYLTDLKECKKCEGLIIHRNGKEYKCMNDDCEQYTCKYCKGKLSYGRKKCTNCGELINEKS